eukprot:SAG31_NODE_13921_length_837_cov_1.395664_1_plen_124_part_00
MEPEPEPQAAPSAASARDGRTSWFARGDPRIRRVRELREQGDASGAAQLLAVTLAELDPSGERPRLHETLQQLSRPAYRNLQALRRGNAEMCEVQIKVRPINPNYNPNQSHVHQRSGRRHSHV